MSWLLLFAFGVGMFSLGAMVGIVLYEDDDNWRPRGW